LKKEGGFLSNISDFIRVSLFLITFFELERTMKKNLWRTQEDKKKTFSEVSSKRLDM
jgi:hypothetical protein